MITTLITYLILQERESQEINTSKSFGNEHMSNDNEANDIDIWGTKLTRSVCKESKLYMPPEKKSKLYFETKLILILSNN